MEQAGRLEEAPGGRDGAPQPEPGQEQRSPGHVFYRSPGRVYPVAVRASGVFIETADGRRLLDGCSGAVVVNMGHGRAEIAEAMYRQALEVAFAHTERFTHRPQERLAELLAGLLPEPLRRVYFVNSGSEAVETAIKLARQFHVEEGHPGRFCVIGRWISYHGNTLGALAAGGHTGRRRPYAPMLSGAFFHIPAPYCLRCPFGLRYPECGLRCAHALEEAVGRLGPETVAAFIAEPIVGAAGGAIVPPPGYYETVRAICDRHGLLWIADEVMTGFGRTGKMWAFEHWGAVPDMVVFGKAASGGYAPLAGVAVAERVWRRIRDGSGRFIHGFTFAGNPVSCAAGVAAVEVLVREGLVQRAQELGQRLEAALRALAARHPVVGEVRGRGMMWGLELVQDRATLEPFPAAARMNERVTAWAFDEGLLVYPGGGFVDGERGDHVMVAPPLVIQPAEIELLVERLDRALGRLAGYGRGQGLPA